MIPKLLGQSSDSVRCGSGALNCTSLCSICSRNMCSPKHESNMVRDVYSCEKSRNNSDLSRCSIYCLLNAGEGSVENKNAFNKQSVCGGGDGSMRGMSCDCDSNCETIHVDSGFFLAELLSADVNASPYMERYTHIPLDPFVSIASILGKHGHSRNKSKNCAEETDKDKPNIGIGKSDRSKISDRRAKKSTHHLTKKNRNSTLPYLNVVVDSGATRHCCNNIDIMTHIRNTDVNIMVGNGNIIKATKMGNIGMIRDVLYLPEIKHFLFSLSYFLNDLCNETSKMSVSFKKYYFEIKCDRKLLCRGLMNNTNLYVMRMLLPKRISKSVALALQDKSLFVANLESNPHKKHKIRKTYKTLRAKTKTKTKKVKNKTKKSLRNRSQSRRSRRSRSDASTSNHGDKAPVIFEYI